MTAITNETRTVRDICNQFLAGRSTDDIASDLNTPRLHVGYVRNATGNRAALDRQRADISAYARAHGQDIDEWIEDDCSGNCDDRPGLDRLHALVAAGRVAEVLVYDMSRLSRNGRAAMGLHEELSVGTRATYVTLDPQPTPALMNIMNAVVAQDEAVLRRRPRGRPTLG